MHNSSFLSRWDIETVVNASGTMTALGASRIVPEAQQAMSEIAGEFIDMNQLMDRASDAISRLTGAEAGFVTSSVSSGISIAVAAAMTGHDRGRIMRLPDTHGLRSEAVIQVGHLVDYGTTVEIAIRLAGAQPDFVGSVSKTHDFQIESEINENTACVIFVVSHHTVQYGMVPLERVVELAHAKGVPVIVDAASEYDLTGFLEAGADLVIYSGHKFLGGPTSGIMAGRADLIEACRLQNFGIGRCMKVGKESIAGVMAALEAWEVRDHHGVRQRENEMLDLVLKGIQDLPGIEVQRVPDPTNNPLERLQITVHQQVCKLSATDLAARLREHSPSIVVRGHEVELGHFFVDACNLREGEAEIVRDALHDLLAKS